MNKFLKVVFGGIALYCFVGVITDNFSFKNKMPDILKDHSVTNSLYVFVGLVFSVAFAVIYLSDRHFKKQKNN